MVTKLNPAVCYLWDSMTSLERDSFAQSVVDNSLVESAQQCIADAYSDNGAAENMLVKLVNNNEAKLAMKLLIKMAASDDWRSFVQRSLKAECVGGGTLLHEAAKYGFIYDLREFITTDLLSNLRLKDNGDTPLHIAAGYGHKKDIETLLEKPVLLTYNKKGWSPLHCAISNTSPSVKIVSGLIKYDPSVLDAPSNGYKNTALHLACLNKKIEKKLLKCFMKADPTICNADGKTPLHLAAERERDPQPITVLLRMFLTRMSINNWAVNSDFNCSDTLLKAETSDELGPNLPLSLINNQQPNQQTFYLSAKLHIDFQPHIDTLLRLCAMNGHRDAVALLLQNGADPKYILHDIVDESAKHPDKINELLDVYETVVENIILPYSRWLTEGQIDDCEQASKCYVQAKRRKIIELVEKPKIFGKNTIGKNVIERAIELGAKDLLLAILNTENVYRFHDFGKVGKDFGAIHCDRIRYDVTNMVQSTMIDLQDTKSPQSCDASDAFTTTKKTHRKTGLGSRVSDVSKTTQKAHRPKKSYIMQITENDSVWREHDILRVEPFKKMSKSYVGFMRRWDFLIGISHVIYMFLLSHRFLPTKCSLNEQFSLNLSDCNTTNDGVDVRHVNGGWLVWPVILLFNQLFSFSIYSYCLGLMVIRLITKEQQYGEARNVRSETESIWVRILLKLIDKAPSYAFSVIAIYWYAISSARSNVSYNDYLAVTSLLFLFGWVNTFLLFCRITKEIYVLSVVLKSVIIRDMLFNFIPVFVVILISFTCAVYVLQMTLIHSAVDFEAIFYDVFATAFSVGNLYDYTVNEEYKDVGGRRGILKAVYVAYLSVTALILFNYLIAMMTYRYEKERKRAEDSWRFDCITDMMQLQRHRIGANMLCWVHKVNYWFAIFCWPNCKQVKNLNGRHFITVQRWRPWVENSNGNE